MDKSIFNNTKEALAHIVRKYKEETLLGERGQVYFKDFMPDVNLTAEQKLRRKVVVLVFAAKVTLALKDLSGADAKKKQTAFEQAVQRVIDENGTERALVEEVIREFTDALGWVLQPSTATNTQIDNPVNSQIPFITAWPVEHDGCLYFFDRSAKYRKDVRFDGSELYRFNTQTEEFVKLIGPSLAMYNTIISIHGDWIYYYGNSSHVEVGKMTHRALYKIRTDGTERTELHEPLVSPTLIQVVGDWIIYVDAIDKLKLYRIKTDGSSRTKICDDEIQPDNWKIVGEWCYYENRNDDHKLYKIRINGTGRTRLSKYRVRGVIHIVDDWIYYSSPMGSYLRMSSFNKMRTDGTGLKKIISKEASRSIIAGDWVYFLYSGNGGINRFHISGKGYKNISSAYAKNFHCVGDWIYYNVYKDNPFTWQKMRVDGTEKSRATPDNCSFISVDNGWIFYQNWDEDGNIYKVSSSWSESSGFHPARAYSSAKVLG